MGFGCIICTEDFNNTDGGKTPMCIKECGHVFHKSCLTTWLLRSNSCPTCRVMTVNSSFFITKLHFQRLSMDNSSILTLLDETDQLKSTIQSKDKIIEEKDKLLAENQKKATENLTEAMKSLISLKKNFDDTYNLIMNKFKEFGSDANSKDSLNDPEIDAIEQSSSVAPTTSSSSIRGRLRDGRISGRAPLPREVATTARARVVASASSRTLASRGRSVSASLLKKT